MPLLHLPNELLLLIAAHLGAKDLSSLILTTHPFYILLTPLLYDLGALETHTTTPTALYWAASHGQPALVAELLLRGAKTAESAIPDNSTALHWAARSGDLAATKLLIGDDCLNAPDRTGEGPVFWAAKAGHEDVVRLLVGKGALMENVRGQLLLHEAISAGFPGVARVLVEEGAEVGRYDQFGWLPLHCAARCGDVVTTGLLLRMGARVGAVHLGSGATALHWAAKGGVGEVVGMLVESGAEVEARDETCGATPLHWAAWCGNVGAVQALLEVGADVNARCGDGNTVLHFALHDNGAGHQAVVRLLLEREDWPNVNARNKAGDTPLRWPVFSGYYDYVEMLLKKGADMFAEDAHGRTVLDCAEEQLDLEMIRVLTRYGTKGWRQASAVTWKTFCRVTPRLVKEPFEQKRREAVHPVYRAVTWVGEGPVSEYPSARPTLFIP